MSFLNDSRYGPDITDTSAPVSYIHRYRCYYVLQFFPGLVLIYEPYYIRINAFLSRGTFGEVFSVSIDGYRRRFAMKTIPLISETRAEDISHEVTCNCSQETVPIQIKIVNLLYKNRSYKHHIVRFELAFKHENRGINYGCLLMERMGCSLFEFLQCRSFQPFPLEEVKVVGKQILKALKHIHKLGIVHTVCSYQKTKDWLISGREAVEHPLCSTHPRPPGQGMISSAIVFKPSFSWQILEMPR